MAPPSDRNRPTRPDNPKVVLGVELPPEPEIRRRDARREDSGPPSRSISPVPESRGRPPVSVDPRTRSEYAPPQTAWSRIADKAIDKLGVPLVAAVVAAGGVGAFMSRKEPPKVPDRIEEIGKLRDCAQKQAVWMRRADRMYRAVLGELGAGVQGAQYPEVEFFPAPLAKSVKPEAAPAVQPVEALPPPPVCEF